ncbi:farnesyl pyrophosphate synthase isoform 2-T2 [Cyanocitta cristata]
MSGGPAAWTAAERQEFAAFFPQIVRDLTEDRLGHPEVGDAVARLKQVLEYNVPGGKGNRGLTVVAAFRKLAGPAQQDPESLRCALAVGWCIELFQAFFLVADDIMDASLTRRGQLCWYKKEGIGLDAINDAFLLESSVYRLLKQYCGKQPYYLHLVELFLQILERSLNSWMSRWTHPSFDEKRNRSRAWHRAWCLHCDVGTFLEDCVNKSQNHRLVWVGRDIKDHLVPLPCHGRDTFHCPNLLQAPSNLALDTSRDSGQLQLLWAPCARASPPSQGGISFSYLI